MNICSLITFCSLMIMTQAQASMPHPSVSQPSPHDWKRHFEIVYSIPCNECKKSISKDYWPGENDACKRLVERDMKKRGFIVDEWGQLRDPNIHANHKEEMRFIADPHGRVYPEMTDNIQEMTHSTEDLHKLLTRDPSYLEATKKENHQTLLMAIMKQANPKVHEFIFPYNPQLNRQDILGQSALVYALRNEQCPIASMQELVRRGAHISIPYWVKNQNGKCHWANDTDPYFAPCNALQEVDMKLKEEEFWKNYSAKHTKDQKPYPSHVKTIAILTQKKALLHCAAEGEKVVTT